LEAVIFFVLSSALEAHNYSFQIVPNIFSKKIQDGGKKIKMTEVGFLKVIILPLFSSLKRLYTFLF
jgi:hypothetical protein